MSVPIYHPDDSALTEQIRTLLYGDQRVTINELQILHTRTFQRLYNLKQLGWANRVYPDADHCRFNHSLGTLEQADRILRWTMANCKEEGKDAAFNKLQSNRWVIRLVALLHDVFHIPYGHTLEDELGVLPRHDEDEDRKVLLLDRLLAEVLYWSYQTNYGPVPISMTQEDFWTAYETGQNLNNIVTKLYNELLRCEGSGFQQPGGIRQFITDFAKAGEVLLYMGQYEVYAKDNNRCVWSDRAPLANVLIGAQENSLFDPAGDYYICDIVGNTISADLLDYGRRDLHCAGLKMTYDDRLLQYFTIVEFEGELKIIHRPDNSKEKSPTKFTRTAINLVRRRIRYDALSEILQILKIRYVLTERVLYHRTKCAAGAMLGKAVSLLQFGEEELRVMKQYGDAEFLQWLEDTAKTKMEKDKANLDVRGGLEIIRALRARRFYKPVYHVRAYAGVPPTDPTHPATMLGQLSFRTILEKQLEKELGFPPGSVIIYCPRKTQLKEAECLVIHDMSGNPQPLNTVPEDGGIGFFVKEANAIQHEYDYLWNMYVFVPERLITYWPAIANCFEEMSRDLLPIDARGKTQPFNNDSFLVEYLEKESKELNLEQVEPQIREIVRKRGLDRVCQLIRETEEEIFAVQTYQRHGKKGDANMSLLPKQPFVVLLRSKLENLLAEIAGQDAQKTEGL
jgi:HD superfamily phosphohydrolase